MNEQDKRAKVGVVDVTGRPRSAVPAASSAVPAASARSAITSTPRPSSSLSGPPSSIVLPERKYFKIGEVAELVGVEPHVLRYWETQFSQLRPHKARSGHRLYRRREVETLLVIKDLLHIQRFTIAGARQALRQQGTTTLLPRISDSRPPEPVQLSLPPTASLLKAAEELDQLDESGDDDEEELELHLAGPLIRRDEVELEIEAKDGDDLEDALAEQLTTQLARRSPLAGSRVSRVEVTRGSRSTIGPSRGSARVRAILEEAAAELEAVVLKLRRT
ncbi:MAG: MerR family transcriptional regulator [Deltaproteobacteria bacterium]|nr:MerR family transcriptional regulator [Deltaproteobacteria bacterium]